MTRSDDTQARARVEAFDLRDLPDSFYDDPYPTYRALRERDPVHRCADGSWFLSRYADVLAVYRDHARFSSDKRIEFAPKLGDGALFGHHTTSLVFRDAPYHTRVRKLIQPFFSPRVMNEMQARVVAVVDELLDRLAVAKRADLVSDYAFALPVEVVCDLLGVPPSDRATLRAWARLILGALEPVVDEALLRDGNRAVEEFEGYLRELVAHKRRVGASSDADVLSTMVQVVDSGADLSEYELVQNCIFFLNAGHETTTNLIGNGMNALFDDVQAMQNLRTRPGLMRTAIDELLRFESSNQLGNRRALGSVNVGGVTLPEGSLVTLGIGAANRDPAQFSEPDRLNLARQPNRHLAFAAGVHTCAGAALARLEARVAIGRLLARFPQLRRDGPIERDRRARFRVIRRLPVALD